MDVTGCVDVRMPSGSSGMCTGDSREFAPAFGPASRVWDNAVLSLLAVSGSGRCCCAPGRRRAKPGVLPSVSYLCSSSRRDCEKGRQDVCGSLMSDLEGSLSRLILYCDM